MRALGAPQGLCCDERRWTAWAGGWVAQGIGTAAQLWPLAGVVDVLTADGDTVALLRDGRLVGLDGAAAGAGSRVGGVRQRLGDPWATAFEAGAWRVLNWRLGLSEPAPIGAVRPRPGRPGAGLLWVDETTVYRLDADGVRVAASLPCPPGSWEQGPLGAACFELDDAVGVLAPRSPLRMVRRDLVAEGARFSADGRLALLASATGAAVVELASGRVTEVAEGALRPVGFGPLATVWDEDAFTLRALDGGVVVDGLCGARPGQVDDRLVGPGGGCWDLSLGARLWSHPCLERGITVVVGSLLACVGRSEVVWLDGQGRALSWVDLDLPSLPCAAAADGDTVVVWSAGGAVRVGPGGPDLSWTGGPAPPPEQSQVLGPNRGHVWTTDGLLLSIDAPAANPPG